MTTTLTPAEIIAACRERIRDHSSDPRSPNYEAIDAPDREPIYDEAYEAAQAEARETRWREYDGRRWR